MLAQVRNLRCLLRAHCLRERLSIRGAAREMGVSFSALARFMRGETQEPGPHMVRSIARFVGEDPPPCPCVRCQGKESLTERLERLEDSLHLDVNLRLMEESLSKLDQTLKDTRTLLTTLHRQSSTWNLESTCNPCQ